MKLKAWQIYLICVGVLSFPVVMVLGYFGYETGEGLAYDMGTVLVTTAIIGSGILGLYYGAKRGKKK